jgi:DNA phosphorothioation-dependent restriction protein DptF
MEKTHLQEAFEHLSQHSVDSVQNGNAFSDFDAYMHVDRPIEEKVLEKMDEIDRQGGGIILLVGSAGDGKSHLISRIKQCSEWPENCFYNDATASSSPRLTAIDTLKHALAAFKDNNLHITSKKLVLAINLGKLNAFIEDEEVKLEYSEIVNSTFPIFDDDDSTPPIDTDRIKVIMFSDEQTFEFNIADDSDYPVSSHFLSAILNKIANPSDDNPFYSAYKEDMAEGVDMKNPLLLNYQLLSIKEVRKTICMTVIEAIVQYNLIITPREFLDFVNAIMVYPYLNHYKEAQNFYDALLPTLLYSDGPNRIQHAISRLDPLKHSSTDHDKDLSVLFTSYSIPTNYFAGSAVSLPNELISRTNKFYSNNGKDIERTTKFVFRLKHLLNYHSESHIYISYLALLRGVFKEDPIKQQEIYSMVSKGITRHYGSYYSKSNMIPLNIQGGEYRMYAYLKLMPQRIKPLYHGPSQFQLRFDLTWNFTDEDIKLRMDYRLYSYLYDLDQGKLALSYENEKDLTFSQFVRQLINKCDARQELTIVKSDTSEMHLSETPFGNLQLQQ